MVLLMFGDRDTVVGDTGFKMLLDRLEASRFPVDQVLYQYVRSNEDFVADHFAPFSRRRQPRPHSGSPPTSCSKGSRMTWEPRSCEPPVPPAVRWSVFPFKALAKTSAENGGSAAGRPAHYLVDLMSR